MKNIEEIREKLGPDFRVEEKDGVITVCYIWDGVEFAEGLHSETIYKVVDNHVWNISIQKDSGIDIVLKGKYKPSTEAAYVEQLKTKAKELFGEIKDGDRFDLTDIGRSGYASIQLKAYPIFAYIKQQDELFLNGFCLYRKGKWAKKIEERVKVEVEDWEANTNPEFKSFNFRVEMRVKSSHPFDPNESAVYLSKCLEEYINKS